MSQIFILPDPNDELIHIYEIDKLMNLLNIHIEKYDSREFSEELLFLKTEHTVNPNNENKPFKIPRQQQNPHYDRITEYLNSLRAASKSNEDITSILKQMITFIQVNLPPTPNIPSSYLSDNFSPTLINPVPDVRTIALTNEGLQEYFNYLLSRYST